MNKLFLLAEIFCLPLRHLSLTSAFGYRIHPVTGLYALHAGIDLRARSDTVFAVLNGKVLAAAYHPLLGVFIRLGHVDSLQSIYGHLSKIFVLSGDSVAAGQPIGITGSTGRVTGEHLHFGLNYRGRSIDPLEFLLSLANNLNQHKKENQYEYPIQTPVRTDR